MLRVAVLEDHPAVLAGLQRLLDSTDLKPVVAATTSEQLSQHLEGARADDVIVVDYDLQRGNGPTVCRSFKHRVRPPAVVIYSASAGPSLAISARIAGADALVDKRAPARALLDAICAAARGGHIPAVPPHLHHAAISRLSPDVPVASMGRLRPAACPAPTADAYYGGCSETCDRPFPRHCGAIYLDCLADGDIITLTAPPDGTSDVQGAARSTAVARRNRRRRQEARDA
jgi:DNA-binding NarL/FixJ family response regulator